MEKRKLNIDELKKDNVFKVPEGYFEELPSIIQSKVTQPSQQASEWSIQPVVKWSLVAASVLTVAFYITFIGLDSNESLSAETMISEIDTDELIAYLEYSDISTEELIADVGLENIYTDDLSGDDFFLEDIEINELEAIDLLEEIDVSQELL